MSADNTSKMIRLLGALRKEMNGAVADSMYYYGENYGLNYGVSLPTIRSKAAEFGKDHELAKYLYKQQVRELRLAALHIAEPDLIEVADADFWAEGVINSEVAEEMAFALLRHSNNIEKYFGRWIESGDKFLIHTAMMAAARSKLELGEDMVKRVKCAVEAFPEERIIAQSAVALLAAALDKNQGAEIKPIIGKVIESLPSGLAKEYIREEMEWRMEY